MTSIHRHALVRHSARRMYDLVNDVAAYPARFAWCEASQVIEASDSHMLARLDLRLGGLRTSFTTRNVLQPPTRIELALAEVVVPADVHARADARIAVPMAPGLRSLNVAVAAAMVLGEALRQTASFPAGGFPETGKNR